MLYGIETDLAGAAGQPCDLDNLALSTLTVRADTRRLYRMRHVELPQHYFVSYANAHGMMQIIPSTGREWAGKLGLPYSTARLTQDPTYNVTIGTAYIDWLIRYWNGNVPLAAASYNGGMGNVQKWVRRYGDPRTNNVDTLEWIEQIPFGETRGYVQRVVENAAVYDRLNPHVPRYGPVHVSRHLGKSNRPG